MAITNTYQRDVMRELGYSDYVVSEMTQALLGDIIADYNRGVKRYANVQNLPDPADVAIDTFLSGVSSDVEEIGIGVATTARQLAEDLPQVISDTTKLLPLVIVAIVVILVLK